MMNIKYPLKITHGHIKALFATVRSVVAQLDIQALPLSDRIAISTIGDWFESDKIKSLLFHFEGEKTVKLKQPVAMSLVYIIGHVDLVHDDYLGNYLFRISNEIHQFYNL